MSKRVRVTKQAVEALESEAKRLGISIANVLKKKCGCNTPHESRITQFDYKTTTGCNTPDPAKTIGISLPQSQWDAIDAITGGRPGRRSQFIQDAVGEMLTGTATERRAR